MSWEWAATNGWWLHSALGGGLLLLVAWGLMHCWRQPVRRQRLGEFATAAALLLAVLSLGPTWLEIPVPAEPAALPAPAFEPPIVAAFDPPPVWPADLAAADPALFEPDSLLAANDAAPAVSPSPEPARSGLRLPEIAFTDLVRALQVVYLVGVVLLLGRWLLGHLALGRLLASCAPATEATARLFAEMASDLRPRPRLLVAPRLQAPVCFGLLRPTVVIPAGWCAESSTTLRWAFAHELTHLRRHDAWANLLFGLAQAVYFYLPWFWWLRRQVRLCQEYVADAAAAELSPLAEDYADFLLRLAPAAPVPATAIGVIGNSSDLFRRITMLLKTPLRVDKCCPRLWSLTAAGVLVAAAVVASGIGLRAEPPVNDIQVALAPAADQAQEVKKEEPKKDPAKKDAPKKGEVVPGLEEIIKQALEQLPAGVDKDQIKKEIERALEKAKAVQGQFNPQDLKKQIEEMQKLLQQQRGQYGQFGRRSGDGRLGARVSEPDEVLVEQLGLTKGQGLVIGQVQADSAAAKAGIKANDILLELGGKAVPSAARDFAKMLEDIKPNTPVDALVLRKGKKETIKGIALPEKPANIPGGGNFGFQFGPNFPGNIPGGGFFPGNFGFGPQGGVTTVTNRQGDNFTSRYQDGKLQITVAGKVADGKAKATEISIQDDGTLSKYDDASKVPDKYRDQVKRLVELAGK